MIILERKTFHPEYGLGSVDAEVQNYINSRDNSSHRFVSVQQTNTYGGMEYLIVWKEKL